MNDLPMTMSRLALHRHIDRIFSPSTQRRLIGWLPWKKLHELRDVVDVMHETSVEIFEAAQKALKEDDEYSSRRVGRGKDIMSVLCGLSTFPSQLHDAHYALTVRENSVADEQDRLSEEELLAQITYILRL